MLYRLRQVIACSVTLRMYKARSGNYVPEHLQRPSMSV